MSEEFTTQEILDATGLTSRNGIYRYIKLGVLLPPVDKVGVRNQGVHVVWSQEAMERARWFRGMREQGCSSTVMQVHLELGNLGSLKKLSPSQARRKRELEEKLGDREEEQVEPLCTPEERHAMMVELVRRGWLRSEIAARLEVTRGAVTLWVDKKRTIADRYSETLTAMLKEKAPRSPPKRRRAK